MDDNENDENENDGIIYDEFGNIYIPKDIDFQQIEKKYNIMENKLTQFIKLLTELTKENIGILTLSYQNNISQFMIENKQFYNVFDILTVKNIFYKYDIIGGILDVTIPDNFHKKYGFLIIKEDDDEILIFQQSAADLLKMYSHIEPNEIYCGKDITDMICGFDKM